jgi:RNA polymerase sigma-70 factor (ECF subfamily)
MSLAGAATVPVVEPAIDPTSAAPSLDAGSREWLRCLRADDATRQEAVVRLHALLMQAARFEIARRRPTLPHLRGDELDDIATEAADDALMSILRRLDDFRGASRFTTWAYKFAVLNAAVEVRRRLWQRLPVPLDAVELIAPDPTPGHYAEAADLAAAVRSAVQDALSPHQRKVLIALVVEEIPIDVLAARLGTTRNALYKNLHDARVRLRTDLIARGFLDPPRPREATA